MNDSKQDYYNENTTSAFSVNIIKNEKESKKETIEESNDRDEAEYIRKKKKHILNRINPLGEDNDFEKVKSNQSEIKNIYSLFDDDNNNFDYSYTFQIPTNFNQNKTNEKSFLGKKYKEKEKIFEINKDEKIIYRLDYYIKAFKTNFLEFMLKLINEALESCNLTSSLGKRVFHISNHRKYQGNSKEKDNKEFVLKTVKEVFTDDDNKKEGTSRQNYNKILCNDLYEINGFPRNEEEQRLKNLLEITIKDALEIYYYSDDFKEFSNLRKVKCYDAEFKKERNRNFSLLQKSDFKRNLIVKNGFLTLVECPFYCHNPK